MDNITSIFFLENSKDVLFGIRNALDPHKVKFFITIARAGICCFLQEKAIT